MILPNTIPLLLGRGYDETVSLMLSNPDDHMQNIVRLSKICKVKIKFSQPVNIYPNSRRAIKDVTEYVFSDFFLKGDMICYRFKKDGRHGQYLQMQHVESYEPVRTTIDEFNSYEDFKKKFDLYFITEELIKDLWEGTSAQHGEKYKPSDFKPVSKAGKEALNSFLRTFKGVNSTDITGYTEKDSLVTDEGKYHILYGHYFGRSFDCHFSRDVDVSHQIGQNRVFYSSTRTGGGKERNGILATRSTYLWLEDD
jgi:hypothetical protein